MAKAEYKYPKDIVRQTEDYISSCGIEQMELPTVEGLALKLHVDDDTLNVWSNKHDDFGRAFRRLKMSQKVSLINGGAFGGKEVNASMFIFLLKANHGLSEPNKLDITSKGDKLPTPILGGVSVIPGNDRDEEDKPANKTD